MRSSLLASSFLALAVAGPGLAFADQPAPPDLLEAMARNFRELNYQGVFTYEQGQQLSSARIVHAVVDGIERERLEHLDGARREFLRLDHSLDCVHAGNRLMRLVGSAGDMHAGATPPLSRLGAYYAFELEGAERVASREGRRIRVSPRDPYRYGLNLVLDDASALLLKAETTDGAGRVLERFQFVDVEIGKPIDAGEVLNSAPGSRIDVAHGDVSQAEAAPFDWVVSWLPEGFVPSGRDRRVDHRTGTTIESQAYTDGLAVFAVFVEPERRDEINGPGQASQGATVAYVTPRGGNNLVTVVGEIPVATARLIANAVNFPETAPR